MAAFMNINPDICLASFAVHMSSFIGVKQSVKARLILEDGHVFEGESFGAVHDVISEFVFNTAMTGYVEVLTDPSYAGQSVVMTYPIP